MSKETFVLMKIDKPQFKKIEKYLKKLSQKYIVET